MFITVSFHLTSFQIRHWPLELDRQFASPCARYMESEVTRLAGALNACTGFVADITDQLPARFWYPFDTIDRLHENVISNICLRNP